LDQCAKDTEKQIGAKKEAVCILTSYFSCVMCTYSMFALTDKLAYANADANANASSTKKMI
jgi:hypothetical protein